MKLSLIILCLLLVTLTACQAQDYKMEQDINMDEGIKVLEKLHGFTGNWTGTGKMFSAPNEAGKPWTSIVNYKGAYDDNFLQMKEIMNIGESDPFATLAFLGWDWTNQHPLLMSVSNSGEGGQMQQMYLIGDKKFLITRTLVNEQGQTIVDQIVTELNENHYTVTCNRTINGGKPFISFEGTYERTGNEEDIDLNNVGSLVPLSKQTKTVACMAGKYHMKGNIFGYQLEGIEYIDLDLGGHAMFINFKFKPEAGDGYYGSSITAWNPVKNRFTGFMLANDGMAVPFEVWLSKDNKKMIYMTKNNFGGTPEMERWIADIDQDKGLLSVFSERFAGSEKSGKGLYIKFTKLDK